MYVAAMPALALAVALTFSSLSKSWLLGALLGARISVWRASIVICGLVVALGGMVIMLLPQRFEWVELVFGIPVMLFVYCMLIWTVAFGHADRTLFRKHKRGAAVEESGAA